MKNSLILQNISKKYLKNAVDSLSLEVYNQEIVGILGPNGAGKTTSFYMTLGLIEIDCGNIFLNGENISHLPVAKRAMKGLAYLPQEPSIFRKLSVRDNILGILEIRKDLDNAQKQSLLEKLLKDFQLTQVEETMGYALSGGERRRVEIARTLALDPRFILLDEPFAGVDPISIKDIKKMILDLKNRNIGILITDHNVQATLDICDRAYILSSGKILYEGTPFDIVNNKDVRDTYLGQDFIYQRST